MLPPITFRASRAQADLSCPATELSDRTTGAYRQKLGSGGILLCT
jgi:hypothetical protein